MKRPLVVAAAAGMLSLAVTAPSPAAGPASIRPPGQSASVSPAVAQARTNLRAQLGVQGVFSASDTTGTPRMLGKLNGYLTPNSGRSARSVALGYVASNRTAIGLDAADITALVPGDSYSADGVQYLNWRQEVGGVPAIDTSLTAAVTTGGRLIQVGGSPAHDLSVASTDPAVSAQRAYTNATDVLGGRTGRVTSRSSGAQERTTLSSGGVAKLVIYQDGATPRLGWRL